MSYNYDKFLRPITPFDKSIKILDEFNNIKYTINPFFIKNVAINNNILKINLKSQRVISLHFPTINEAKLALTRIQIQIDTLIKNVPLIDRDVKNYVDSIFNKVDRYSATSSTPFQLPIIGDIINLETQKNLAYTSPQSVIIHNDISNLGNDYFVGKIDSYDKNTGDMVILVDFSTNIVTGETYSTWYINLSGEKGQADKYYTISSTTLSVPQIGEVVDLEVDPYLAYSSSQNVVVYSDLPNLYDNDYQIEGGYFSGQVDYYDFSTGLISIVVDNSIGIGTYSTWYMNLSGVPGVGATGSVETTDRLISTNNLEVVLDSKGTLNTPLLLPIGFTAICDESHMVGSVVLDGSYWEFQVEFQVSTYGIVAVMINNIFPILYNPGYDSGYTFRFTETNHGIPNYNFDIELNDVVWSGPAGWTSNLAVSQGPDYPSTIKSLGAIKLTSNSNSIILGTDGILSIPNSIQFPDDKVQTTAYIPKYKVFTALLTQSGGSNNIGLYYGETTIGVTYTIIEDGPLGTGYDFTIIGATNNDIGTVFIATGTTPTWGIDSAVGLAYNAGAPIVTILENTIGNVWFEFGGADGVYAMKSDGLFTNFKTVGFITYNDGGSTGLDDKPTFSIYPSNDYNIYVNSALNGTLSNNVLAFSSFEIRVYN